MTMLHVSECRAIGQSQSTYRCRPRLDPSQERMRTRIIALAKEYGRYGIGR